MPALRPTQSASVWTVPTRPPGYYQIQLASY